MSGFDVAVYSEVAITDGAVPDLVIAAPAAVEVAAVVPEDALELARVAGHSGRAAAGDNLSLIDKRHGDFLRAIIAEQAVEFEEFGHCPAELRRHRLLIGRLQRQAGHVRLGDVPHPGVLVPQATDHEALNHPDSLDGRSVLPASEFSIAPLYRPKHGHSRCLSLLAASKRHSLGVHGKIHLGTGSPLRDRIKRDSGGLIWRETEISQNTRWRLHSAYTERGKDGVIL